MNGLGKLLTKLQSNNFKAVKKMTAKQSLNQLIVVDEVLIPLVADDAVYRVLKDGYDLTYYYKNHERRLEALFEILKNNNVVFDIKILDDFIDENYQRTQLKIRF